MDVRATKDRYERETEEADRLVRPSPKLKPPRHDKRREEMQSERDSDTAGDPDMKGDPDMSMNYKTIGGRVALRYAKGVARHKRKPSKKRKGRPKPGPSDLVTVRLKGDPDAPATQVTEDTLREESSKYEKVEPKEKAQPEAPVPQKQDQPEESKSQPAEKSEANWSEHRGELDNMAANNSGLTGLFKAVLDPGSQMGGLLQGNTAMKVEQFFKAQGVSAPKGIETADDLLRALLAKPPKKKKKKKKKAPKTEGPEAEEAESLGDDQSPEDKEDEEGGQKKPSKKKQNKQDSLLRTALIMDTFPPSVSSEMLSNTSLSLDDVRQLASSFQQSQGKDVRSAELSGFADETAAFYATDPDKVKEPKFVYTASGKKVNYADVAEASKTAAKLKKALDKTEDVAETAKLAAELQELEPLLSMDPEKLLREFQLETVAHSLAAQAQISRSLQEKSGASPRLADKLSKFMLSNPSTASGYEDFEQSEDREGAVEQQAEQLFYDTLVKSGSEKEATTKEIRSILGAIEDPAAQKLAVGYFQAQDYQAARSEFLNEHKADSISERQSPEEMVKGLKAAEKFLSDRQSRYPEGSAAHTTSSTFRLRVMKQLQTLAPDKYPVVQASLDKHDRKVYDAAVVEHRTAESAHYDQVRKAEREYKKQYNKYLKSAEQAGELPVPAEPVSPKSVTERMGEYEELTPGSRRHKGQLQRLRAREAEFEQEHAQYEAQHAQWRERVQASESKIKPPQSAAASLEKSGHRAPMRPEKPARYDMVAEEGAAPRRKRFLQQREASTAFKVASRYSFNITGGSMGHSPESDRTAVYHGVDPHGQAVQVYERWQQAHACDLAASDFSTILKSAREWLTTPVLATSMEGVVRDSQIRAALDLAIQTVGEGKYQAALHPAVYNDLLAKLAGKSEADPLLTVTAMGNESIYGVNPREVSMKASDEIRTFAARVASENPELSYDLMALADKVAGLPPEFLENIKKKKDEAKGDDKDDKKQQGGKKQQKEASTVIPAEGDYVTLRSLVIRTASQASPEERTAFAPILQALKKS